MSQNSSSGKKLGFKRRSSKSSFGSKKRSSSSFSTSKRSSGQRPRSGRGKRKVTTFDPSSFVKKVDTLIPVEAYVSKNTFADFDIVNQLKTNIEKKGYINPTPIQDQSIPYGLEQRDIIGSAETGTGKTAAFLIPLVHNVLTEKTSRVLIIAPTRELAAQIQDEFKGFARNTDLRSVLCIGGASINVQVKQLKHKPQFIIGTPGRLKDLQMSGYLNFNDFDSIVLDEVDRMLDMGFIKDITYIIDKLPKKRHSLFFSATMTPELKKLMDTFLQDPVTVRAQTRESAANVNQEIIKVGDKNKIEIVHDLLIKPEFKKVLIFTQTKRGVDKLARQLNSRGFNVASIHGNKTQAQRNKALLLFKTGKVDVLLATDVVARGIDIEDISHVINFDLPQTYEDYIHRIGRTGRADKIGQAITLV